ncbi:hypothetical protein HAX54_034716 [Datura stramonium]|uniref:Uncharacterized protein n=1 Tax=Datura stramonium TaxID=4076 RepID=A0ABS8VI07_DATST|nr:hypothetical protein [Datura stramonium]
MSDISLNGPGRSNGVRREVKDCMLGCDAPFNPLRVKVATGRSRKKRKAGSEDDSDGPAYQTLPMEADLMAMQELLGGLPILPMEVHHLVQLLWTPRAYKKGGGEDEKASNSGDDSNEASS